MVIFMAINHWAITAILAKKSIMAVMASVLKCQKYDLYGCLVKELSKCRSPVKTALKKIFFLLNAMCIALSQIILQKHKLLHSELDGGLPRVKTCPPSEG